MQNMTQDFLQIFLGFLTVPLPHGEPSVDGGDMNESKSSSRAIAGGVVGGLVGLGFLLGLLVKELQAYQQPEMG